MDMQYVVWPWILECPKASQNKYPRKTKLRKQTNFEMADAINENEKDDLHVYNQHHRPLNSDRSIKYQIVEQYSPFSE